MSSTKSSPRPTNSLLHPSLQVALASLDVPLDAELERYRQHRKQMSPPPPPPSSSPVIVEGQLESPQPPSSERSPWEATSEAASGSLEATDSEWSSETSEADEADSDVAIEDRSEVAEVDSATPPRTYLESAERLRQGPEVEAISGLTSDRDPSAVSVSDLSTASNQASNQDGDGEKRTFTALGVGSVLLFLAATATLGYVLVNPESLGQLGLERFFGGGTASESEGQENSPESASAGPTRLPTSPDLAAEEFIQLDLSTLSRLDPETRSPLVTPPPTPQEAPQPSPEAAASAPTPSEGTEPAENTLDNISALLTPESTGESQPEGGSDSPDSVSEESETPEETTADNAATDADSGPAPRVDRDRNYAGFIFVVVDYNDQVSRLEQVREVVPDAYLREFPDGVKVQVGAFDDTGAAQGLVNRLGEDGISAQVYQPR